MEPSIVDSRGRPCPLPIIDLARAITDVDLGAVLVLLSDDPGSKADVPAWCRMRGQELTDVQERDEHAAYLVRRLV